MIVDIGGGTTEGAVISLGGMSSAVRPRRRRQAGRGVISYIRAVQPSHRREHFRAHQLENRAAAARRMRGKPAREVKGRDLMNGVPREVVVSQRQVAESLTSRSRRRRGGEGGAGEHAARLAADIVDKGIELTAAAPCSTGGPDAA